MKEFTDDEKIIARNIDKLYRWIARDKTGRLGVFSDKPYKDHNSWNIRGCTLDMNVFCQEFNSIRWDDEEPTLIKDIYEPQILDDAERKYLTAVLKPFHQHIRYVKKVKHNEGSLEYIKAAVNDDGMIFPDFKAGKMYIGMKLNKEYSCADLGITYD